MKIQITDSAGNEQVINLSEDQVRGLEQSAARNNISFAEALQQAIAGGNFLEAVEAAGGKVLVEKDKQIRPVVKEPQVA